LRFGANGIVAKIGKTLHGNTDVEDSAHLDASRLGVTWMARMKRAMTVFLSSK
jgi:hypothetical protein